MTNTTCHKVRHKFQLKYVHVKYISSQAQISQFIIIIFKPTSTKPQAEKLG